MRKSVIETRALVGLLLGAALAYGQPPTVPPPKTENVPGKDQVAKSKLEVMLEKALKDNPDVRLAAAKVAEAEAELNRSRLLVVQKVATAYQAVEAQKAAVESAAVELQETTTAYKSATVPQAAVRDAERKLIEAKTKLASLEAELPYLLGQQAAGVDDKLLRFWPGTNVQHLPETADAEMLRRYYLDLYGRLPTKEELAAAVRPSVQGPTADRIRAALDKPFTFEGKGSVVGILQDMNKLFQETNPGLIIKDSTNLNGVPVLSAHFDKMPFGAALEWVEDSMNATGVGDFKVVIRDYGIAIVDHDRVPPGAPLLHDFWKGAKAEDKNSTKPETKDQPPSPPAKIVEGLVKDVDHSGRIRIDIGKMDGVINDDILTVVRQESEAGRAVMIGELRVVKAGEDESMAECSGKFTTPIQRGDKVYPARNDK